MLPKYPKFRGIRPISLKIPFCPLYAKYPKALKLGAYRKSSFCLHSGFLNAFCNIF